MFSSVFLCLCASVVNNLFHLFMNTFSRIFILFFAALILFIILWKWLDLGLGMGTVPHKCMLVATSQTFTCSIGKNGIRADKKEGDGATPAGDFPIREILYRADRMDAQETKLLKALAQEGFKVQALTPNDGWVDDVNSDYYNQFVKISAFKRQVPRHERLWREDHLYDIIVVLGYNDDPIMKGKGSAIFMHLARQNIFKKYGQTDGCIGLNKTDLLKVLNALTPTTTIEVPENAGPILIK